MNKFKAGDTFVYKKDGKTYTGEVLFDFGKTYLVVWDHAIGTYYLPTHVVDSYEKGHPDDNSSGSPIRPFCGGLSASEQGDGQEQIRKD